ncbi:MAG: hypothetical protein AAF411_06730 [Myxococcota bacterium]
MSEQARRHVFPEVGEPDSIRAPDWMRSDAPRIMPVDFDALRHPPSPNEAPPPPPPPDPLADEKAALAAERAEVAELQVRLATKEAEAEAALTEATERSAHFVAAASKLEGLSVDVPAAALVEIGVALARALILDAFEEAPERAAGLAQAALDAADTGARLRIGSALHVALMAEGMKLDAEVDPTLEPYGCIAETRTYSVDAGLESRLERALGAMREAL